MFELSHKWWEEEEGSVVERGVGANRREKEGGKQNGMRGLWGNGGEEIGGPEFGFEDFFLFSQIFFNFVLTSTLFLVEGSKCNSCISLRTV